MNDNKKEKKNKTVLQKVLLVLECIVIAVCMVISIIVIVKPGGVTEQGGAKTTFLPVQSDSMEPTIATGSLVFTKAPEPDKILDLGTIITFVVYSNQNYLNTHRIVGYRYEDATSKYQIEYFVKGEMENYEDFKAKYPNFKVVGYITRGDKYTVEFGDETLTDFGKNKEGSNVDVSTYNDTSPVELDEVVAVYKSHIGGLGYVVTWLMQPTNFFIVIMIPLILLLGYNVYQICRYVISEKVKKQTATAQLSSEEIARKAVEEYIAQQQKLADGANTTNQSEEVQDSTDEQEQADEQDSTDGDAPQKNDSDDEKRSE